MVFIWHNTTRMHVFIYLSPKYQRKMTAQSNYCLEEAGMAQLDDDVGELLKHSTISASPITPS